MFEMKKLIRIVFNLALLVVVCLSVHVSSTLAQTSSNIGILVIAHGSTNKDWNWYVERAVDDMETPFPVELGFLESAYPNIAEAAAALVEKGVEAIVAMPLFVSSQSGHIEEIKYILGLRKDSPSGEDLEPLTIALPTEMTAAIDDHPFAVKTLADNIWELERFLKRLDQSVSGTNLVLVGHGDKEAGETWEATFSNIAEKISAYLSNKYNLSFKSESCQFLHSLKELKNYCADNKCECHETSVYVPFFLAPGFISHSLVPQYLDQIKSEVEGIKIAYIKKALLPSTYISKLIETRVAEALTSPIAIYEHGQLKEINTIEKSIEDNEKICPCRLFAYKAFKLALHQLGKNHPRKEQLAVFTNHPCPDIKEVFEELAATVIQGTENTIDVTADNYYYEVTHHKKRVIIQVKPEVFPEAFFELRLKVKSGEATKAERNQFEQLHNDLLYRVLWTCSDKDLENLFSFSVDEIQ